jgi:hypothetical protein
MSSPLAIAAVTAAIKDLLNDGLLNHDLSSIGSFTVTSTPPDRITTGQTEPNQLNVFLYQVTPNQGWRNAGLPSRDASGVRLTNPPLALDLHYLITAYGASDLNAEILLGYAMQLLHDTPVLTRQQLRVVLGGISPVDGTILPSPFGNLSALDLADQVELVKLTPVFLGTEDLSKLWTAMQARYRPTMAYMASVVLIQSTASTKAAPPVLKRGPDDAGPVALASPFANLTSARVAASDLLPAMRLGDEIRISGTGLDTQGAMVAVFEHTATKQTVELSPVLPISAAEVAVQIPDTVQDPNAMHLWTPGVYAVFLRISRPNIPDYLTNSVPIALAPVVAISPLNAAPGNITLTVTCTPRLGPEQGARTLLAFGGRTIPPASVTTPANTSLPSTLTFQVNNAAAGEYLVRLRIAGIESLPVTASGSPPKFDFDPQQKVVVQ